MHHHTIGRTPVTVTPLGLGGTALGNLYAAVPEDTARDTVASAHDLGVRFFDTAPVYGNGLSEERLGAALALYPRDEITLSTKVGYTLAPLREGETSWELWDGAPQMRSYVDFSAGAIEEGFAASLERLGVDHVDIVWFHDPDEVAGMYDGDYTGRTNHFDTVMAEAYPLMDRLRSEGVVRALGVGITQWQMLEDFARAGEFDCFLLAGRYTLLEQGALASLLPLCAQKEISVVIGGPYSSGILATGAVEGAFHNYAPATDDVLARVGAIEAVCARHDVPLPAAALQFPLGHPAVVSVIPGARSPEEVRANAAYLAAPIPDAFWDDLKNERLLDADAPMPAAAASV
jgi:D-threo-aldose 1-dehydrogenase